MMKNQEPVIVGIGFKPNCRGGWWYQELQNRYSIQIIPSGKGQRGWRLSIAHSGTMRWGKQIYSATEAATITALHYVKDHDPCHSLLELMQNKAIEHARETKQRIKQVINHFVEAKDDSNTNERC